MTVEEELVVVEELEGGHKDQMEGCAFCTQSRTTVETNCNPRLLKYTNTILFTQGKPSSSKLENLYPKVYYKLTTIMNCGLCASLQLVKM